MYILGFCCFHHELHFYTQAKQTLFKEISNNTKFTAKSSTNCSIYTQDATIPPEETADFLSMHQPQN
jgi:hypothetical protein